MFGILKKIVGSANDREIRKLNKIVEQVNSLEESMQKLSDRELRGKTAEFKQRLAKGETLDHLLPEAYAVVREAARRVLNMRHFDVQILGGIVLHQGRIAEMKTGEGKTLVATLPAYLNALTGEGVHVVTVNEYLASYQSVWMGKVYEYLGLSVGLITHDLDFEARKKAYAADITYGTNNEFGFDYLRDNMVIRKEHMVQRALHYAIVDEVDSILIDEARTPLIISGHGTGSTDRYKLADQVVRRLRPSDYEIDEKMNTVTLTEEGISKVEKLLGIENLGDPEHTEISHHINQALRAHTLMKRDKDYVVKDGQVIIVDEFTGRLMFGRRYSDGLHQAIEAKEGVRVERENQTLATITFQNYFRMYRKLAGMTGTALTEEEEFRKIYGLDVVVIPTNLPMIREDLPDVIYKNEVSKFRAIVEEIAERHAKGQPVLVGTVSIEKSEYLSSLLKKRGIPHQVLNAKFHEQEAEIVAQAGRLGAVTVATNMAGRGTDILLGGNPEFLAVQELKKRGVDPHKIAAANSHAPTDDPEILALREEFQRIYREKKKETDAEHDQVVALGGLAIIGTERHEARRIDNQLRGRAGRQGDPGVSRFYISLEDDLMRLFGSDHIMPLMEKIGMEDDMPIEHPMITRAIETAQKRVESRNFSLRKHVLEYDDVMNQQRELIYKQRRQVLEGEDLKEQILDMVSKVIERAINLYAPEKTYPEEWDLAGLIQRLEELFLPKGMVTPEKLADMGRQALQEYFLDLAKKLYAEREARFGEEIMRELERAVVLQVVDTKWMDHIDAMDQLRQGIGLRAYGQRDPLIEYKFEGYEMFQAMIESIQEDVVRLMYHAQVQGTPERKQVAEITSAGAEETRTPVRRAPKVGRNDPCPCGSGKKYKKCCGRNEA